MADDLIDIELLRRRDSVAWDMLYEANCRRTYRVLHCVTSADQDCLEELNQDVWLSAILAIQAFDATRGTPQDWLLGIARNKGLTYLRKQYRNRLVFVGANDEATLEQPGTRDAIDYAAERLAILRASVASLPENWQFVLLQKYEQGLSVVEIADRCETTPKAIESLLSRARQRLRELVQLTIRNENH